MKFKNSSNVSTVSVSLFTVFVDFFIVKPVPFDHIDISMD